LILQVFNWVLALAGFALFQIFTGTGLTNYLVDSFTLGIKDLQEKEDLATTLGALIAIACFIIAFYISRFFFRYVEKTNMPHKKAIKGVLITIYFLLAITGSALAQQPVNRNVENETKESLAENLVFKDPDGNFSFSYSPSWEKREPILGMKALVKSKKYAANCNVRYTYQPELADAPSNHIIDAYGVDGPQILAAGIYQISNDVKIIDGG